MRPWPYRFHKSEQSLGISGKFERTVEREYVCDRNNLLAIIRTIQNSRTCELRIVQMWRETSWSFELQRDKIEHMKELSKVFQRLFHLGGSNRWTQIGFRRFAEYASLFPNIDRFIVRRMIGDNLLKYDTQQSGFGIAKLQQ